MMKTGAVPMKRSISQLTLSSGRNITFSIGDITEQDTDAIVNAANSELIPGSGVAGAIHRAGGPAILSESKEIVHRQGPVMPGHAVITRGGDLPARFVIHAVGPVWEGGKRDEVATLASCYHVSIELADQHQLSSLSFPSISTGAFGYPLQEAAKIAVEAVAAALASSKHVREIRFILFDPQSLAAYVSAARKVAEERTLSFDTYIVQ